MAPAKKAAPAGKAPAPAKKAAPKKAAVAKAAPKPAAKQAPAKEAPSRKSAARKAPAPARRDGAARPPAAAPAPPAGKGTASEGIGGQGLMWEHFDAKFLEGQRKLLLEERVQYTGSAESLQAEARQLTEEYEPGDVQFDDESGEGDSIVVERDRDLALSAQALQIIGEIDAALSRLRDGSYGISEVSGLPIPTERLKAIPWTSVRVEEKVGGIGHRR